MVTQTKRIKEDIEALAQFTATPGEGMTRFTFTKQYDDSRKYIIEQMRLAGLEVREDALGDIIGRLPGSEDLPPVMIGSHFDSVKNGGNFDGPAGVVLGLEVARAFRDEGVKPRRPIEVCALIEEEGGRFGGGLFASRGMAGRLKPEDFNTLKDSEGISIGQAMAEYGFDPQNYAQAVRAPGSVAAFLEMHIEQGPILENSNTQLGVVSHIVGLTQLEVEITGRPDHAGTTPMDVRADALACAAAAITKLPEFAAAAGQGTVATVGVMQVFPGAANIVPGRVSFKVDIRSKSEEAIVAVRDQFFAELEKNAKEPLRYKTETLLYVKPVEMDPEITRIIRQQCEELGVSYLTMTSGAGHDAMVMAEIAPAALLFVPSKQGRSHCPEEWTDYDQIQKAAEVYYRTLRQMTL